MGFFLCGDAHVIQLYFYKHNIKSYLLYVLSRALCGGIIEGHEFDQTVFFTYP